MGATGFLIILSILKSASTEHEPKVYEELAEELPTYQRTARHLDVYEKQYEPPIFNYRHALQQDRLQSRYTRQQQADARNIKYPQPINHEAVMGLRQYLKVDRGIPVSIPFVEENSDWKPFQPAMIAPTNEIHENDLDIAGSEAKEQTLPKDRQDQYVYKSADEISELQKLLGKSPSLQLQGLQKLIQPTLAEIQHNGSPLRAGLPRIKELQEELDAVNKAQENEILAQAHKKAEAHVKAQHEAIALASQKAQEDALAKISAHNQGLSSSEQYNILEDVNHATAAAFKGLPQISYKTVPENEDNSVEDTPELAALHGRHFDLRNIKPIIRSTEAPITNRPIIQLLREESNLHYKSTGAPNLQYNRPTEAPNFLYVTAGASNANYPSSTEYASPTPGSYKHGIQVTDAPKLDVDSSKIQNYSPLSPYDKETGEAHEPTQSPLNYVEPVQKSHQHIQVELVPTRGKTLYAKKGHSLYDDVQQYAAKYAFGYRIIDEKHGNDFGHHEERNDELTKGQYFVSLPDGRRQKVDYYADASGYHAKVSYDNEAKHPYVVNRKGHLEHL